LRDKGKSPLPKLKKKLGRKENRIQNRIQPGLTTLQRYIMGWLGWEEVIINATVTVNTIGFKLDGSSEHGAHI